MILGGERENAGEVILVWGVLCSEKAESYCNFEHDTLIIKYIIVDVTVICYGSEQSADKSCDSKTNSYY